MKLLNAIKYREEAVILLKQIESGKHNDRYNEIKNASDWIFILNSIDNEKLKLGTIRNIMHILLVFRSSLDYTLVENELFLILQERLSMELNQYIDIENYRAAIFDEIRRNQ